MKNFGKSVALASVLLSASLLMAEPRKPSILFCSPQGPCYGWLDLDYANELCRKGFEVDCTETLAEITPERIKKYNVLVMYLTPDAFNVTMLAQKSSPEKVKAFAGMVDQYVAAGGGVLLMPTEGNLLKVLVAEDIEGRKAITFARRCWKDGSLAISFCSDHVNDGTMALAHGPYSYPCIRQPSLPADVAGDTWDGGPLASLPLTGHQNLVPVLESDQGREDGARFDQIPLLEFTDEGAMAVSSARLELFDERVKNIVNPWHTYGPIGGPSRLMHYTQRYCEWLPPTVGVPQTGWAGPGVRMGTNASLLRNKITFKQDLKIKSLGMGYFTGNPNAVFVLSSGGTLREIPLAKPGQYETFLLQRGDWFGCYSTRLANSNLFFNRGEPLRVENRAPYLFFWTPRENAQVRKGQTLAVEIAAIGFPVNVEIKGVPDLLRYVDYLKSPAGMQILRGKRLDGPGLLELAPDAHFAVEVSIPKPQRKMDFTLPGRISGLNPRWSAGLFQKKGYVKGDYGSGENRYRALGLDLDGNAYLPLYVDRADLTHVLAGHPVIAGPEGKALFVQVTKVGVNPDRWHVSVNNPTDQPVTTALKKGLDLPGLSLPDQTITLKPGEHLVVM